MQNKHATTIYTNSYWNYDHTYQPSVLSVAIPIYIIGGYQWYFYNKPHFNLGLRVNGYVGYVYNKMKTKDIEEHYHTDTTDAYLDTNREAITINNMHYIYYGAEAQFLWDFLDRGSHTLGVHFSPIGFMGNITIDNSTLDSETVYVNGGDTWYYHSKNKQETYITYYTISFGLHYYINIHHQLFMTYQHQLMISYSYYRDGVKDELLSKVALEMDKGSAQVFFGYSYKF